MMIFFQKIFQLNKSTLTHSVWMKTDHGATEIHLSGATGLGRDKVEIFLKIHIVRYGVTDNTNIAFFLQCRKSVFIIGMSRSKKKS